MRNLPLAGRMAVLLALGSSLAAPAPGRAAETATVTVEVKGVASSKGEVLVALCDAATFLKDKCPFTAAAPAKAGDMTFRLAKVGLGQWAVQAYHDENGNHRLDRNDLGIPTEGAGFSRDARGRYGPPGFSDAAVPVKGATTITLNLAY